MTYSLRNGIRHIFLAHLLAAGFLASGTVVPRHNLQDLTHGAVLVIHGRVLSRQTAWDTAHRLLWTHYSLEVIEPLKGSPLGTITVSEPGGTLEGVSMPISGVVGFAPNEEVIVFLHRTPIGYLRTYGYGQGKFTVVPNGGAPKVRTNLRGMALMDPAPRRATTRAKSDLPALDGLSLAEFKNQVRKAVSREASR